MSGLGYFIYYYLFSLFSLIKLLSSCDPLTIDEIGRKKTRKYSFFLLFPPSLSILVVWILWLYGIFGIPFIYLF